MKRKVISALMTFALCGTLAWTIAPSVVHAETCSNGHEMVIVGRVIEDSSVVNPYDHSCWGYYMYYCESCYQEHHVSFSVVERHDMCWNDDMTALVCSVCGYEDKW